MILAADAWSKLENKKINKKSCKFWANNKNVYQP